MLSSIKIFIQIGILGKTTQRKVILELTKVKNSRNRLIKSKQLSVLKNHLKEIMSISEAGFVQLPRSSTFGVGNNFDEKPRILNIPGTRVVRMPRVSKHPLKCSNGYHGLVLGKIFCVNRLF